MDYQLYELVGLNQKSLIDHIKVSRDKFNHLYGGFEHATKYYYLYNFFTITSCNQDVYLLYLKLLKCIKQYFDFKSINASQVWMQTWMNIHTENNVLTSHSHAYPIHGYLSLSNHDTDTVFTDGHDGNELYRINNKPFQLYIGPGYRHHHVVVNQNFSDERITLGFDIEINDTITENFSFIPLVL